VRTVSRVGTPFVPGAELGRRFYREVVRPLLDEAFPGLPYAAGHLGNGSDVLGYDTAMSRDHEWGPRVTLVLPEADAGRAPAIRALLAERLPPAFLGHPTGFRPNPADPGVAAMAPGGEENRVFTTTLRELVRQQLNWDPAGELAPADWLSFPGQQLLTITAGPVHHDGVGELTALRNRLGWYPRDVWRYLLAAGWARLGQEQHLMGRAGHAGDELGSALIGGRLARDVMTLGFLLERRYAPYPKWFGTAFGQLEAAAELGPLLGELVSAQTWPERQDAYATAAGLLLRRQNELGLAEPVDPRPHLFFSRPFWVVNAEQAVDALVAAVTDPGVRHLTGRKLIGGVDQWSDSTDLKAPELRPVVRRFYS
jgi:hypothetical protein